MNKEEFLKIEEDVQRFLNKPQGSLEANAFRLLCEVRRYRYLMSDFAKIAKRCEGTDDMAEAYVALATIQELCQSNLKFSPLSLEDLEKKRTP